MIEPGKVSVIMNCRNSASYLRAAIDSVYAQTYPNWEIVFYDNASTDESPEIARSYDGRLRYILNDEACLLGEARNRAMAAARGEFIAFLDCDDVWEPEKLAIQVSSLQSDPGVGIAYSNFRTLFQETGASVVSGSRKPFRGMAFRSNLVRYKIAILTVLIRASVLEKMDHWFDPALNLTEDLDFFLRILAQHPALYCEVPLGTYRVHASNLTGVQKHHWLEEHQYVYRKLRQHVPGFDSEFAAEGRKFYSDACLARAKLKMEEGHSQEVRLLLRDRKWDSPAILTCYVLSYFPRPIWHFVQSLYLKVRYSLR